MIERIVINTGPLVALAKVNALDLIGRLPLELICPQEVRSELDIGTAMGLVDVDPDWLSVESLAQPLDLLARASLDMGEAAVIQLAVEKGIETVCIDERRGRRAASSVGLRVVGTLGLLLRAKNLGLVPAVRPYVDSLQRAGDWYNRSLIEAFLEAAGE